MAAPRVLIVLCLLYAATAQSSVAFAQARGGDARAAAAEADESARRAQQSANDAKTAADNARAERERAAKETADALRDVQTAADKAEVTLGRAETQSELQNTIMSFTQYAAFALAFFAGFQALSWHRRAKSADAKLKKVDDRLEMLGKTGESIQHQLVFLDALRAQVKQAFTQVDERLVKLFTPGVYIFGVPNEEPPPYEAYDDDALIALSTRIDLTGRDKQSFVDMLVLSARYWRRYDEFERAVARLRRAIEIDDKSVAAHHHLGRTLWSTVIAILAKEKQTVATGEYQKKVLTEAKSEIERAEALRPANERGYEEALYDLACIARLEGDFDKAVELYSRGAERSRNRARHENHAPDFEFDFALACLQATRGQFADAFPLLATCVHKKERWDQEWGKLVPCDYVSYVEEDPDLAGMRTDTTWGPKLTQLVAEAKASPPKAG